MRESYYVFAAPYVKNEILAAHESLRAMAQKTATGYFDMLDTAAISTILSRLDIDSQVRLAVSCSGLSAMLGARMQFIAGTIGTAYEAYLAGSVIFAKHVQAQCEGELNWGLSVACRAGNVELAEIALSRGAKIYDYNLRDVCMAGHYKMLDMLLERSDVDPSCLLISACEGGNIEIVKMVLGFGCGNLDRALVSACGAGRFEVAKLLVRLGAKSFESSYDMASYGSHQDSAELMVRCGAEDWYVTRTGYHEYAIHSPENAQDCDKRSPE